MPTKTTAEPRATTAAPRKRTKPAPDTPAKPQRAPAQQPPTPDVTLDLDHLDRDEQRPPFSFLHEGEHYQLLDPTELDWKTVLNLESNPSGWLRDSLVGDADRLYRSKLPMWKLEAVMRAYADYYGLPDPLAVAGSLGLSAATGGQSTGI